MKTLCLIIILAFSVCRSFGQAYPLPAGCMSWWPGENNANDVYGTNNGTFAFPGSYSAGKVGNCFNCSIAGSFMYTSILLAASAVSQGTIELWFNTTSTSNGCLVEFSADRVYDPPAGFDIGNYLFIDPSGKVNFQVAGGSATVTTPNAYNDGVWHHVAITFSTTNPLALYIDGSQKATSSGTINNPVSFSGYWKTAFSSWYINGGNNVYYGGLLDEVTIYNVPLTASQILGIYNAGSFGKTTNSIPSGVSFNPAWYLLDP